MIRHGHFNYVVQQAWLKWNESKCCIVKEAFSECSKTYFLAQFNYFDGTAENGARCLR